MLRLPRSAAGPGPGVVSTARGRENHQWLSERPVPAPNRWYISSSAPWVFPVVSKELAKESASASNNAANRPHGSAQARFTTQIPSWSQSFLGVSACGIVFPTSDQPTPHTRGPHSESAAIEFTILHRWTCRMPSSAALAAHYRAGLPKHLTMFRATSTLSPVRTIDNKRRLSETLGRGKHSAGGLPSSLAMSSCVVGGGR